MLKKIGKFMHIALVFAIISACGVTAKKEKILEVWTPFTGPDGAFMQKIIDEYNEKNDIEVSMQVVPGDQYYEKLRTAVQSNSGPDLAIVHADQIPSLVHAETVHDIDSYIQAQNIQESDYIESAWHAGMYKGKRYGLALDVHPLVLYYNKDLVSQENLSIPKTYSELIENGKKATKNGVYGFATPTVWPTNLIYRTAMLQNGEDVISADGMTSNVATQTSLDVIQKLEDLSKKEKIAPEKLQRDGHIDLFKQGKAAFVIDGLWMSQGFDEVKLNYGVAPMGNLFGDKKAAVWANSHQIVFTKKNDDEQKEQAKHNFVDFLSNNSLEWAKAGQIPANKKILESADFKAMPNQVAAAEQMSYAVLAPQMDTWLDIWTSVEPNLSSALLGEKTPKEAMEKAKTEGEQKAKETTSQMA